MRRVSPRVPGKAHRLLDDAHPSPYAKTDAPANKLTQKEEPQLHQRTAAGHPGDIAVFIVTRDTNCAECGEALSHGSFLRVDKGDALCLDCAGLGHLEFLPSGNAALTRRASKHSTLKAVVLQWSKRRKRYERRGTLVEQAAIERAEAECEADAPQRTARREVEAVRRAEEDRAFIAAFASAIQQQFPGCPP